MTQPPRQMALPLPPDQPSEAPQEGDTAAHRRRRTADALVAQVDGQGRFPDGSSAWQFIARFHTLGDGAYALKRIAEQTPLPKEEYHAVARIWMERLLKEDVPKTSKEVAAAHTVLALLYPTQGALAHAVVDGTDWPDRTGPTEWFRQWITLPGVPTHIRSMVLGLTLAWGADLQAPSNEPGLTCAQQEWAYWRRWDAPLTFWARSCQKAGIDWQACTAQGDTLAHLLCQGPISHSPDGLADRVAVLLEHWTMEDWARTDQQGRTAAQVVLAHLQPQAEAAKAFSGPLRVYRQLHVLAQAMHLNAQLDAGTPAARPRL